MDNKSPDGDSTCLRPIPLIVALTLVLATPSGAASDPNRFDLWNGCRPVGLVVEDLPDDAGKIGLRKEDIEIAVRARLRSARIYEEGEGAPSFLYVDVSVVSHAVNVQVEFKRHVEVLLPGVKPKGMEPLTGYASGWQLGQLWVGVYSSVESGHILSSVARHTDKFIDKFLRVNADACRRISN